MWNQTCPLCFVRVPRKLVLTRGDDLVCPSCHAPLEISRASRVLGSAAGLLAGYLGAASHSVECHGRMVFAAGGSALWVRDWGSAGALFYF